MTNNEVRGNLESLKFALEKRLGRAKEHDKTARELYAKGDLLASHRAYIDLYAVFIGCYSRFCRVMFLIGKDGRLPEKGESGYDVFDACKKLNAEVRDLYETAERELKYLEESER